MEQALSDGLPVPKTFQQRGIGKPDGKFSERDHHDSKSWRFRENRINHPTKSVHRGQHNRCIEQHCVKPCRWTRQWQAKDYAFGGRNGEFGRRRQSSWLTVRHLLSEEPPTCASAAAFLRPMSSR